MGGDDSWEIQCSNSDCCIVLFSGATSEETSRSWNTRATLQPSPARCDCDKFKLQSCDLCRTASPVPSQSSQDGNQVERLTAAINWACGIHVEGVPDFDPPADAYRYWWRSHLTNLAGLVYDGRQYVPDPTASPALKQAPDQGRELLEEAARMMQLARSVFRSDEPAPRRQLFQEMFAWLSTYAKYTEGTEVESEVE